MGSKTSITALAVVLSAVALAGQRSKIETVSTQSGPLGLEVSIHGENLAKPTQVVKEGSNAYTLWFHSRLRRPIHLNVGKDGLAAITSRQTRWSSYITLTFDQSVDVHLEPSEDGWKVTIPTGPVSNGAAVSNNSAPNGSNSPTVAKSSAKQTATPKTATSKTDESDLPNLDRMDVTVPPIHEFAKKSEPAKLAPATNPVATQEAPTTKLPVPSVQVTSTPIKKPIDQESYAVQSKSAPKVTVPAVKSPAKSTPQVARVSSPAPKAAPITGATPAYPKSMAPIVNATRVQTQPDRVSLEFTNTDIVQILRALAIQTGVNIVTSPDVKGNLTVSLNDVSVDEALRMVTGLSEYGYAHVGGTVIVAPLNKIEPIRRQIAGEAIPQQNEPVTEAYLVKGGMAQDLVQAVAGKSGNVVGQVILLATPPGSASRQSIVLRGPAEQVKIVERTLEQLDDADESVGTLEVYEVKHLDPRALREELIGSFPGLRASVLPASVGNPGVYTPGEIAKEVSAMMKEDTKAGGSDTVGYVDKTAAPSASATGTGGAAAGGGASSGGSSGGGSSEGGDSVMGFSHPYQALEKISVPMKIVLRGSRQQIDHALEYLKKIDVAPKQVALELRVMELTKEDELRLGLDWSAASLLGTLQSIQVNQSLGDTSATAGTISGSVTGATSVTATLDKLANNRNLIAKPNLLAIDGRSAELFVGDVIRYIKTIQSSQNGTTVETGEERVGVRLAVLPRVGGDGRITLEMQPVVSYLTGYTPVPGGGELPQTSERGEQTTAILKSGSTIALGGLIQTQDTDQSNGIPILKDLPIVGQLFRRRDHDRIKTEIVFFLTAKVVEDNDTSTAADPRVSDKKVKG